MSKRVILIIQSRPDNTDELDLSKEQEKIEKSLRDAGAENKFEVRTRYSAGVEDLAKGLASYDPEIVHFMGHGAGEDGLLFQGENGRRQLLANDVIEGFFELASKSVKLVFLNACYSEVQANIITKHIDYVVGMNDKVYDENAISFAGRFYDFIGLNRSIEEAFKYAMLVGQGTNVLDYHTPVLKVKKNTKPSPIGKPSASATHSQQVDESLPRSMAPKDSVVQQQKAPSFLVPSAPLLVIPTLTEYEITADKHYLEVSTYFESYWGIVNARRASTLTQLKRELGMERPTVVYVYAKSEDELIFLDTDLELGQKLSLLDLAKCFAEEGLRPLLILALVGRIDFEKVPTELIQQTRFVWCLQSIKIRSGLDGLSATVQDFIKQTTLNDQTSVQTVIDGLKPRPPVRFHSDTSDADLTLKVDAKSQRDEQQFRAALLRLLLGRESLKSSIGMKVQKHLGRNDILVYAITGTKSSCVFDFPHQLRYYLAPNDRSEHGVTIINYPLHLTLDSECCEDDFSIEVSIMSVIDQGLRLAGNDLQQMIAQKVDDYGMRVNSSAIVFHWNVTVNKNLSKELFNSWLEGWHTLINSQFSDLLIPNTTLVQSLCLQTYDDEQSEVLHGVSQVFLRKIVNTSTCLSPAYVREHLGQLEALDIEEFFGEAENQRWFDHFRLKDFNIETSDLAQWVCNKTNGEFEAVVSELWKVQQTNYVEYFRG